MHLRWLNRGCHSGARLRRFLKFPVISRANRRQDCGAKGSTIWGFCPAYWNSKGVGVHGGPQWAFKSASRCNDLGWRDSSLSNQAHAQT
ncbi:MAG: hypothetical protein RL254_958, partial [Planctomycetota bacterium]